MFTGIVEELGTIEAIDQLPDAIRLSVRGEVVLEGTGLGDSIAVNGCCLTVVSTSSTSGGEYAGGEGVWVADVMQESLDKTSLGGLAVGDRVNLERAVTADKRLGGHIVQGHVDTVGHVVRREPSEHWDRVTLSFPEGFGRYLVDKGSITIDGVSLTVIDPTDTEFTVSLIPETLARTTMGVRQPGDAVNLEADVLAKHVEKFVQSGLLEKLMKEHSK